MSVHTVNVLYENQAWLPPLLDGLGAEGLDVRLFHVNEGSLDPSQPPPEGIWLNRISPSSHTRGHDHTVPFSREILFWLEAHGRRVVNGSHAFELEMSKLRQALVLHRHGIRTPKTALAVGTEQLLGLAKRFEGPFITKHNQGGKGLGIVRFDDSGALERHVQAGELEVGPDHKVILQQYIESPEPFITRVEIVGGRFLFAMRSATTTGFELCPSDACQATSVCPADGEAKFSASPLTKSDPLVEQYLQMCTTENIEVAGIEFIEDKDGNRFTYDINGTTNYNSAVEADVGINGMREIARYLHWVGTTEDQDNGEVRATA